MLLKVPIIQPSSTAKGASLIVIETTQTIIDNEYANLMKGRLVSVRIGSRLEVLGFGFTKRSSGYDEPKRFCRYLSTLWASSDGI